MFTFPLLVIVDTIAPMQPTLHVVEARWSAKLTVYCADFLLLTLLLKTPYLSIIATVTMAVFYGTLAALNWMSIAVHGARACDDYGAYHMISTVNSYLLFPIAAVFLMNCADVFVILSVFAAAVLLVL